MGISDQSRWANLNNPYAYRNDNLRRLGFKSYTAYLHSSLWLEIRKRVIERAKGECERCRRPATQVHHRAYDPATLRGETTDSLTAVCSRCHQKAEMRQKPKPTERGTAAYTRMERANKALFNRKKPKYRSREEAVAANQARSDLRRTLQEWNQEDDDAALAWFAGRMG